MLKFASKSILYSGVQFNRLQTLSPIASYYIYCHFSSTPVSDFVPDASSQTNVAIFWDLNNKPPKTISLFDAAIRIKKAALTFGVVRYMAAFGDRNWLSSVAVEMRESSKDGKVKREANFCGVCGRRFYDEERLVNHFKQVHETEQRKRLNQLESARGSRKVKLVGKFSMKMNKYKNAAKDVLNPKVGSTLSDDLRSAGFGVKAISDRRKVAGDELRRGIWNVIEMRQVGCVVIVSDDSEFVSLLNEAKLKQLKTVVVGDSQDGELKRTADASFSWKDIILGKAKKEAVSVVGRWKDRNVLKSLEWSYNPETENTQ